MASLERRKVSTRPFTVASELLGHWEREKFQHTGSPCVWKHPGKRASVGREVWGGTGTAKAKTLRHERVENAVEQLKKG